MINNAELAQRTIIATRMYSKEHGNRLKRQTKMVQTNEQQASLNHLAEIEYYKDEIKSLSKDAASTYCIVSSTCCTVAMEALSKGHASAISEMDRP